MNRLSKRVICGCCILGVVAAASGWAQNRRRVDGVAATVNQRAITLGDVASLMEPTARALAQKLQGEALEAEIRKAERDVLNFLIEQRLILDAYEKEERKLPDWYIEQRIAEIVRERFGDDEGKLLALLAKEGMTMTQWRDGLRDQIVVSFMRQIYANQNIRVSAPEIKRVFDEGRQDAPEDIRVLLSLIVLEARSEDGRAEAEKVRERVLGGEDFTEVARSMSRGPRAQDGGDWGWVNPRDLRSELAEMIQRLSVGDVGMTPVLDGRIYLVKIRDRKNASAREFEDAEGEIDRGLRQREGEALYRAWVERLKRDAHVRVVLSEGGED